MMRAVSEAGNRTIYAMRQDEVPALRRKRVELGNGRPGNSLQADAPAPAAEATPGVPTPPHLAARAPGSNGKRKSDSPSSTLLPSKPPLECSSRKRLING